MSKKKYMEEGIFDIPRIPENEFLFKSIANEEEEKNLKMRKRRKKNLDFSNYILVIVTICYHNKEGVSMKFKWIKCPKCGNEHFIKITRETRIYKFPA